MEGGIGELLNSINAALLMVRKPALTLEIQQISFTARHRTAKITC
jgi:hypothetical protein